MADSLLDLSAESLFPFSFNWSSAPSGEIALLRNMVQYPGTSHQLTQITEDVPMLFSGSVLLTSREENSDMLSFIVAHRGRANRFWVKYPDRMFTLKSTASSGAVNLICYPNGAHNTYQGRERIYIDMPDGDTLTRKVNTVTYSEGNDELTLSLNNTLDRDVLANSATQIGRLLLVRMDRDDTDFAFKTDSIAEVKLKFYELVKEYS